MHRRLICRTAWTTLMLGGVLAACGVADPADERVGVAQSAFTETESEPNTFSSQADPLKAVDEVNGSMDGQLFTDDWFYSTARGGDLVFAVAETGGSLTSNPSLSLYADADTTTALETDLDDGPAFAPVIAGAKVPALTDDTVFFRVFNGVDGPTSYTLVSYVADPNFVQSEEEPANGTTAAPPIVAPMVTAFSGFGDVDYFPFEAEAGDEVVIIMDDDPNGDGNAPTVLTLRNPSDTVSLRVGDNTLAGDGNATSGYIVGVTDTYYVRVTNSSTFGDPITGEYAFVVLLNGRPIVAPAPMDETPFPLPPTPDRDDGLKTKHPGLGTLTLIDTQDTWRMIGDVGERVYAYADARHAMPSQDVRLAVHNASDQLIEDDEDDGVDQGAVVAGAYTESEVTLLHVEHGGTSAQVSDYHLFAAIVDPTDLTSVTLNTGNIAGSIPVASTITRAVAGVTDTDYFAFEAKAGETVVIIVDEDPDDGAGTELDLSIQIRDDADQILAVGDNGVRAGAAANAVGPLEIFTTGTYHLRVSNDGGTSAVSDDYEFVVLRSTGPVSCGDGDKDGYETCDDGDLVDGNGCSAVCAIELGYDCVGEGAGSCTPNCGDSMVVGNEQCDPPDVGNGCASNCMAETGWDCAGNNCVPICGDSLEVGGEQCDPPNVGNGCAADCTAEAGWDCSGSGCTEICGDSLIVGTETCDDGNATAGDGCDAACAVESGWQCAGTGAGSCMEVCGDGVVVGTETCDDGGTATGDGCDDTCAEETGWSCLTTPPNASVCTPDCGDGLIRGSEGCDDGNINAGDGCSDTCTPEGGWSCAGEPSSCTTNCGDGQLKGAEVCDDGNATAGDGCDAACAVETGWMCSGEPSSCVTVCGDGIIAGTEACDDGGTADADGCDATCAEELGWTCSGEPSVCTEDMGQGGMGPGGMGGAGGSGGGDVGGDMGMGGSGDGGEAAGGSDPVGGGGGNTDPGGGDDGGCSCRAAGSSGTSKHGAWFVVVALGIALSRRRRRTVLVALVATAATGCGEDGGEAVGRVTQPYTESETGNNFQPSDADVLKAVDDIDGSITGSLFGDWYLSTAREGDLVFAIADTQASPTMDVRIRLFADGDTQNELEFDDDDGPGLSAVIAGAPLPALDSDGFLLFVSNASGTSDYRLISYAADPAVVQAEVEDNGALNVAEPVVAPLVTGFLGLTDSDYFAFEARELQEMVIIVDEDPNGDGLAATSLELRNANDVTLASGDDVLSEDGNATARISAPSTGTYYVRLATNSLSVTGEYRFVVLVDGRPPVALPAVAEDEPNFTTVQADGLKGHHAGHGSLSMLDTQDTWRLLSNPGDYVFAYVDSQQATGSDDVRLTVSTSTGAPIESDENDGPGGGAVVAGAVATSKVTHLEISEPATAAVGDYHVFALAVNPSDEGFETESLITGEHNATLATADAIGATRIEADATPNDVDYFEVKAQAGDNIVVIVDEAPNGAATATMDLSLEIRDAADQTLATGDDEVSVTGPNANAVGPVQVPADGSYYLRVANDDTTAGFTGEYDFVILVTNGPVSCGDGDLDGVEACDDGNLDDGDGCSATCVVDGPGGAGGSGGTGGGGVGAGGAGDGGNSGGSDAAGGGGAGAASATTTGSGGGQATGDEGGCAYRSTRGTPIDTRWAWLLVALAGVRRRRS